MYDSVLDNTESMKLQKFLNGSEPGILYFYGAGGSGKSTLLGQIKNERPTLFNNPEKFYFNGIHTFEDSDVQWWYGKKDISYGNYRFIAVTTVRPSCNPTLGPSVDNDMIVHFKKNFTRPGTQTFGGTAVSL
jgi:hypothetical protein